MWTTHVLSEFEGIWDGYHIALSILVCKGFVRLVNDMVASRLEERLGDGKL